MSFEMYYKWV